MTNAIQKHRKTAFERQNGHCCYCGFLMWLTSAGEFAKKHQLSTAQARHFQCTAEHLTARQDGGGNIGSNIAAACLRCNQLRHKRANPPEPPEYQQLVQKRLRQGRWCTIPPKSNLKHCKPLNIEFTAEHQQARA